MATAKKSTDIVAPGSRLVSTLTPMTPSERVWYIVSALPTLGLGKHPVMDRAMSAFVYADPLWTKYANVNVESATNRAALLALMLMTGVASGKGASQVGRSASSSSSSSSSSLSTPTSTWGQAGAGVVGGSPAAGARFASPQVTHGPFSEGFFDESSLEAPQLLQPPQSPMSQPHRLATPRKLAVACETCGNRFRADEAVFCGLCGCKRAVY